MAVASQNEGERKRVRRKHKNEKPPDIAKVTTFIAGIVFFVFVVMVFIYVN